MNEFSKKTSYTLIILSVLFLAFGTILMLMTKNFIDFSYDFLAHKIFHREFDLDKWLPTIESLFCFPILFVTAVNAVLFPKYSEKQKILILSVFFFAIFFSIIYAAAIASNAHVNSDIAAEFILARECVLEKSILPTGYYYATELRTLNTELISAPIFLFTHNWLLNKVLTTFFCCVICFFTTLHFLKVLEIKERWLKFFISFMIFCPFSTQALYIGTWANFYIPHIVCCFIFLSIFLNLINHKYKKEKFWFYFFLFFSFFCGLSTIRYVLNFLVPMTFAAIYMELKKDDRPSITNFKDFWLNNFTVKLSVLNFFTAGAGYVFSSVVLQRFYTLSHFNKIQFCPLGETSLLTLLRDLLSTYGYQEKVSVMTPSGVVNLLIIAGLILFIMLLSKTLKSKLNYNHKLILLFIVISFIFNTFVYYTVEFYSRYYYSVLILLFPAIAILMNNEKLSKVLRYLLCTMFGIAFITSSFISLSHFINTDENASRKGYINFLKESNYKLGYSIFENADVTIFLTNGEIAVGNLTKTEPTPNNFILEDKFGYSKWLTAKSFYEDNYDGNVFLLLDKNTYNLNKEKNIVKNGKAVYQDDYFIIFDYESNNTFKESF